MKFMCFQRDDRPSLGLEIGDLIIDARLAFSMYARERGSSLRQFKCADVRDLVESNVLESLDPLDFERFLTSRCSDTGFRRGVGEGVFSKDRVTLRTPVLNPSKVICLGQVYPTHVKSSGRLEALPEIPVVFTKPNTCLTDPGGKIVLPRTRGIKVVGGTELALVVGRRAKYLDQNDAMSCIAGYTILNDVTARGLPFKKGQNTVHSKMFDTFSPVGPYFVPRDNVADPGNLKLVLRVNGEALQEGSTAECGFTLPELTSYVSSVMTLLPGDIIATGDLGLDPDTPGLAHGDTIEAEIEDIGILANTVVAPF